MRKLLSYRDARLLVAGQTLSAFGDFALWIVMAVWMKSLTGSSWRAGLVFFVLAFGNLAGPLGGLLADRVRRRPLMIATDLALGASVLLLLLVHNRGDAWLIYLVALLYGMGGAVFFPARSALLRLMLPEDLLAEANGMLSSAQQGIRIVAPLAGAGLYVVAGGGVVAILDAATFVGSALFLSLIRVGEVRPQPEEQHFVDEVTAGFRHVWRTLPLRQLVAGVSVALLVVGFSETLIFFVIARVGEHPSFFGVMATLQGVGAIAGGLTAAPIVHRLGDLKAAGIGLGLFGVCALLLTLPELPVVLLAFLVAGVGIAWVLVGYGTALQTRTPFAIQGRVSAAADLVATLAQTTSIAAGAALSIVVDYRVLFVLMAAVLGGSALYLVTRREPLLRAEVAPVAGD
ncbi:MAG TPA: MFS transporter [Gaiellaceae bacterium]|nr:MFS transporter [Gaiellaceae bacterium]